MKDFLGITVKNVGKGVLTMCNACNPDSGECSIWIEPLDKTWYLEIMTSQLCDYEDDWIYEKVHGIKYCPFCGEKLYR